MRRRLTVALAVAVLGFPGSGRAQDAQLVRVKGHRLEVVRRGDGQPVVVIEAGIGADWRQWGAVIDSISESTTVVAYSRAGYGGSDPVAASRSLVDITSELESLLRVIDAPGPYVLVGHSFGGLLMRVFAAQHPTDTAGVLLVDATHERQVLEWDALSPGLMAEFRAQLENLRKGPQTPVFQETETMWPIMRSGDLPEAYPFPEVPVVVLTSTQVGPVTAGVPFSKEGRRVWRELHTSLIAAMDRGVQIVTARSGHNIQRDEPQLVVDSIRLLLDWTR